MTTPPNPYQTPPLRAATQGFQFTNPQPPNYRPLPPQKSYKGALIAVGVLAVLIVGIGIGSGSGGAKGAVAVVAASASATSAAPTVTVTATAPVTTAAQVSTNVLILQAAWGQVSVYDQATIRTAWSNAKGNNLQENVVIDLAIKSFATATPSLTRAEVRNWLDWTLTH